MSSQADLQLEVMRNRLVLRDVPQGRTIDQRAVDKFSTDSVLIADQVWLEEELKRAIKELASGWRRLFSYPTVVVTRVSQPLVPVERAALHAAIMNAGARKVIDEATPEPIYSRSP